MPTSKPRSKTSTATPSRKTAKRGATKKTAIIDESESPAEDASDAYHDSGSDNDEDEEDVKSLHSDALDEESDYATQSKGQKKRRRVASPAKPKPKPKSKGKVTSASATKPKQNSSGKAPARKKRKVEEDEDEDEGSELELKDGQEVVGKVIQAPKTGWVPEGQVSQHTLDFLMHMQDPACNDRVWFKLHEPIYRRCEKEFKEFIEAFTTMLTEVDPQIPPLPPKDLIHRIYRDIRFSNDKTPYKRSFSASCSRSGRKGIFAFFQPGNESALAAGAWCPAKNELNTIRNHILHSSDRLREIISGPEFVSHFGDPHPHPKGKQQSVFGRDDELKTAPKGVDKNHKDIDLLKCRSLAVSRTFTDEQVLKPGFIQELEEVVRVLQPFVHCLNDMITLPVGSDDGDEQEEEEGDEEGDE
ncbi:hypothetical protein HYDPIDRAFT_96940 [Hydnomerulius pinastri MD-312]|uniref:DUF2461 domain-containing protein n=1 Tax=Hydnomerulius pinastri MD-312 TaxID=994086 RepID=A0A0C9W4G1_9AGAM|nr:hypothetical protein HYDPIDRAFT_96940 [Hydnomerulius pinastri MD-312]